MKETNKTSDQMPENNDPRLSALETRVKNLETGRKKDSLVSTWLALFLAGLGFMFAAKEWKDLLLAVGSIYIASSAVVPIYFWWKWSKVEKR